MSKATQDPESYARSYAKRKAKQSKRYWYVINVLRAPRWKALMARESVLMLRMMFPEHEFPPDLVALEKRGPAKGTPKRKKAA